MSSRFPGRRDKPHSAKPYDRPKSFLQRVTKTVSDYLPSWLYPTSWVASGSQAEVERPSNYATDEETGEDTEEDLDVAGPSGLSLPVSQKGTLTPSTVLCSTSVSFTRKPLERSSPPSQQTLVNGDDHSDNSETSASTSGCSSLAPSQDRKRSSAAEGRGASTQLKGLQVSKHHLEKIQKQLNSNPLFTVPGKEDEQRPATPVTAEVPSASPVPESTSVVSSQRTSEKLRKRVTVENRHVSQNIEKDVESSSTRTSLWSEEEEKSSQTGKRPRVARPQPVAPNKRPCFSVSAFGSPLRVPQDKSLKSTETNRSPFYQGQTTYGGASAYKKPRIGTPYNSVLRAEAMKVRQSGAKEVLSSAAQKVLNVLENMSTPLTDAKKIPVENISTDFALSYTPSMYARRPLRNDGLQTPVSVSGPPKTSIPVQGTASQQKHTPLLNLLSQTVPSPKPSETTPTTSRRQNEETERRSGGAVHPRVGLSRPSKQQRALEEEPPPEPDLPQISLVPQGCTPSFNFSIPTLTSTPIVETHPPSAIKNNYGQQNTPKTVASCEDKTQRQVSPLKKSFVFSSPIENSPPSGVGLSDSSKVKDCNFHFRSPVFKAEMPAVNKVNAPTPCPVSKPPAVNFNFTVPKSSASSTSPLRRRKNSDQSQEETPAASGLKPASELIMGGSVMDILGKPSVSLTEKDKPAVGEAGQKKCPELEACSGLVQSKDSDSSCVAYTNPSPSPKESTKLVTSTPAASGFGAKFAPPAGSWSCPVCMVNNSAADLNCLACTEPKPGISKPPSDTSSGKSAAKISEGIPNKFGGLPLKSTPSGNWECDVCYVRNEDSISKCLACESPRRNVSTAGAKDTSGFKFGQQPKETSTQVPASTFKFGLPTDKTHMQPPNVTTPSGFSFAKADVASTQSMTEFKFGLPSTESAAAPKLPESFKFGVPVDKSSGSTTTSTFKFGSPITSTTVSGGFKFGLSTKASESAGDGRTEKTSDGKAFVVDKVTLSSAPAASADNKPSECGEAKPAAKLPFVFGGQSATAEKELETTPTLTFGQSKAEPSKPALGSFALQSQKQGSSVSENSSAQPSGFSFGNSALKPSVTVSEPLVTTTALSSNGVGQKTSLGSFKFGASAQQDRKQDVTTSSSDSGVEKTNAAPVFTFGNHKPAEAGQRPPTDTASTVAPTISAGFQFAFKGKENDSNQNQSVTIGSTFGVSQVSSTASGNPPSFTSATSNANTANTSLNFGMVPAQPLVTSADSTTMPSAITSVSGTSVTGTGGQSSAGAFVFGSSKPAQASSAPAAGFTFSFGNSTSGNLAKPVGANTAFTFGSNTTSSMRPGPPSVPFTFGKVDATPAPNNNNMGQLQQSQPQATPPIFTFGTQKSTANSSNNPSDTFGSAATGVKPVFGFPGATGVGASASPSAPSFGQPAATGASATTEPFRFGAPSASVTSSSSGLFQLDPTKPAGSAPNASSTSAGVFRFGATQSENSSSQQPIFGATQPQPVPTGGFTFGSPAVPSTGSTFPPAENTPFVFGSAAASNTSATDQAIPSFNFQPGVPAGSNPFSVTNSGNSAKRPIRRGVRRVTGINKK